MSKRDGACRSCGATAAVLALDHEKLVCCDNCGMPLTMEVPLMQEIATGVMPVVGAVSPAMFVDLPYSPAVLLDACFDASITDDAQFRTACGVGYGWYFEGMWDDETHHRPVFVGRFFTLAQVKRGVEDNLRDVWFDPLLDLAVMSLAWVAGFTLGWLSALALTQPVEAGAGLAVLVEGVEWLQRQLGKVGA